MDEATARHLPEDDLRAIFGVVVTVHGELTAERLDPELTERLVQRLSRRGLLPPGAPPGELNALLADLCQRLHWAMGAYDDYPAPSPRTVTYELWFPDQPGAESAARRLSAEGGNVEIVPPPDDSKPGREVRVTYADLVPSTAHQQRIAHLTELADRNGGHYKGTRM